MLNFEEYLFCQIPTTGCFCNLDLKIKPVNKHKRIKIAVANDFFYFLFLLHFQIYNQLHVNVSTKTRVFEWSGILLEKLLILTNHNS